MEETVLPSAVPGGGPRQSMSLPHNVHPSEMTADQTGNRWKRFQPLKRLQRMFRRKSKTKEDEGGYHETSKSFSASHLQPVQQRRPSQHDPAPMQSRLSMSHDSIFQSDCQQQDDLGSTLSIPGASRQLTAELRGVLLKRRGDDSDDDPGLPHSPATPPTVSTRLQKELKGQSGKSAGSCSDGSLLSMYSSGTCTDEDIFGPISTHHSRASLARDHDNLDLETAGALSHSAAKHRIAVRPRRNHGAPRQHRRPQRPQQSPAPNALPPTVEEETPPVSPAASSPPSIGGGHETSGSIADRAPASAATGRLPRLPAVERARRAPSVSPSRQQSLRSTSPEGGGAIPPRPTPVKRSKSSVADRRLRDLSPRKLWSRDSPSPGARDVSHDGDDRKAEGFFSRIFGSRRSGRGKRKDVAGSETMEDSPASARPPAVPRPTHRHRPVRSRSPPSALHADVIRPPPSSMPADVIRPPQLSTAGDVIRPVTSAAAAETSRPMTASPGDLLKSVGLSADSDGQTPLTVSEMDTSGHGNAAATAEDGHAARGLPDALLKRTGPAFLAEVRAEVRALASGERGDDRSGPVSPLFARKQRSSAVPIPAARGSESPHMKPRLVGLTSYQQRVAQMQGGRALTPPEREPKRRSFSCENISDDGSRRNSACSGMALGSVLSLIKATATQEPESATAMDSKGNSSVHSEFKQDSESSTAGFGVSLKSVRRDSSGSPGAGPKSLDSSLRSGTSDTSATPQKASSAESMHSSDRPDVSNATKANSDRRSTSEAEAVPEFLKVHLQVVEGRQVSSEPVAALRQSVSPVGPASHVAGDGWRASLKTSSAASGVVPLYSPSCEKRSSVAVREPETARKESEDGEMATTNSETSRCVTAESPPVLRRPVATPRASPDAAHRVSPVTRSSKPVTEAANSAAEPVVLRNKTAQSEDSELLKVFKRRSLRTRDCDDAPVKPSAPGDAAIEERSSEPLREDTEETVTSVSRELRRSARLCGPASPTEAAPAGPPGSEARSSVSESRPLSAATSDGRPMSANSSECSDSVPRRVSVVRRESEVRRGSQCDEETPASDRGAWLKQTVRERREQREQREMRHLRPVGTAALSATGASTAAKDAALETETSRAAATRSSRVLQMANTFQKLQTT